MNQDSDELLVKKLQTLKQLISKDIPAYDIKLSLFIAAAITYRYDSCCIPFPELFKKKDSNEKDIDRLLKAIESLPSLLEITTTPDDDLLTVLTSDSISLLFWVFIDLKVPELRSVHQRNFREILSKAPQDTEFKLPTHIFEVRHDENSNPEVKFRALQNEPTPYGPTQDIFAFHGTKLFYVHNILYHGLQQHLNKNALFGEGLYFSTELNVSLPYSRNGIAWNKSTLGDSMACLTFCQVLEHPVYTIYRSKDNIQTNKNSKDLPMKYIVARNNEVVRLRYLLVYATKTSNHKGNFKRELSTRETSNWKSWFNFRTLAVVYLLLLAVIGMSDSPYLRYLKKNFYEKVQSSFKVLMGRE